jgi:phosphate uptake regulator
MQSLYIQGFDEIEINDLAVTSHIAIKLSEIAKRFIGMEIIHVGDEKIVLRCLTVPEMDSRSLLSRMAELISDIMDSIDNAIMFKDLNELNTAMKLEDDTDRLYFLITRYENRMAKHPSESDDKIVAKALEEIADSLMDLCFLIRNLREEPGEILILLREIRNIFNFIFHAYAEKDLVNAENAMNQLKKLQIKINESPYPFIELYRCIKLIGEVGFNNAIRKSVVEYL